MSYFKITFLPFNGNILLSGKFFPFPRNKEAKELPLFKWTRVSASELISHWIALEPHSFMIFLRSLFAPENVLPFNKHILEVDTFFFLLLFLDKEKGERKKRYIFFTAFLCFLRAHSINSSVKSESTGLHSIKNCSDYAMQFCSHYFITICHSSGQCCASSFRGEKAPSPAARSLTTQRH